MLTLILGNELNLQHTFENIHSKVQNLRKDKYFQSSIPVGVTRYCCLILIELGFFVLFCFVFCFLFHFVKSQVVTYVT